MVANFNVWKDHETVVRAMPAILKEVPDAELVFVGHERGTLSLVDDFIRQMNVRSSVTIVNDCSEPEGIVAGSHVAVLASHVEGFSTAMLEYMALGKPVVASDTCGDVATLVRDAQAGFIYPHRSEADLARGILTVLREPTLARRMGDAGRTHARTFTLERMVTAYESLYAEVLRQ